MSESPEQLLRRLQGWVDAGALRPLDLALARFIHRQGPEPDAAVVLAAALTSERNGRGHVCLDLGGALEQPMDLLTRLRDDVEVVAGVQIELKRLLADLSLQDWVRRLSASKAVYDALGDLVDGAGDDQVAPLVLAGGAERPLLYLRRYWRYEQCVLDGIIARLQEPLPIPEAPLKAQLAALFDAEGGAVSDDGGWQKVACALAARNRFAIITGGPGTGKTTTVVRLLALLQGLALDSDNAQDRHGGIQGRSQDHSPLRIHLAAPTGKAAARLNESIAGRVASLKLDHLSRGEAVRTAIPTEVTTLHRLLGPIPDSRRFRHHAGNPLVTDLVVVDEASMVDVEVMAHLLQALPPAARLILLGDKDQLASVEAGAVLGDLCRRAARPGYTGATLDWLRRVTGEAIPDLSRDAQGTRLDQAIAMLRKSYRFHQDGGIGALAALVNADAAAECPVEARSRQPGTRLEAALQLFQRHRNSPDSSSGQVDAVQIEAADDAEMTRLVRDGYRGYLDLIRALSRADCPDDAADRPALDDWINDWARRILRAHGGFQLLTALRRGPWGVEGLNRQIIEVLRSAGLLSLTGDASSRPGQPWFAGRPVLVMRNDYGLRLMNGDIGIALPVPVAQGADGETRRVLRVAFAAGDGTGGIRWILPSRLQWVETVFAMTVHKSQGSEFGHTALILPDRPNPVLTRELVYTAVTRSRSRFTLLFSKPEVLGQALSQQVQRLSGIRVSGALQELAAGR